VSLCARKSQPLGLAVKLVFGKVQIPTPTSNLMVGEALELIIVNCKLSSSRFMELP
jgi:hypothetical protein